MNDFCEIRAMFDQHYLNEINKIANKYNRSHLSLPKFEENDDQAPWFLKEFDKNLTAAHRSEGLLFPNFAIDCSAVCIFSDYSGESSDSKFITYSFLFCSFESAFKSLSKMMLMRKEHALIDPLIEIKYKDFRNGKINRAIPDYLDIADNIVGLLFSVVVDKRIKSLFGPNTTKTHPLLSEKLKELGYTRWKPPIIEKVLRISYILSYLSSLLIDKHQKCFWMTDEDDIAANRYIKEDLISLVFSLVNNYTGIELGNFKFAVPFKNNPIEYNVTDIISIADVVAGSINEYFNVNKDIFSMKRDASKYIIEWLCNHGLLLSKYIYVVRPDEINKGIVMAGLVSLKRSKANSNIMYIPIHGNSL